MGKYESFKGVIFKWFWKGFKRVNQYYNMLSFYLKLMLALFILLNLFLYLVVWANDFSGSSYVLILILSKCSYNMRCPWWCLSNEWYMVNELSQLIYISSGLKTYLKFPTTASFFADWPMCGLCMNLCSGWIYVHQSFVLRRCVHVVFLS